MHFHSWNDDKAEIRQRLLDGGSVKILYENPKPWFWKCSASKLPKPASGSKHYNDTPQIVERSDPEGEKQTQTQLSGDKEIERLQHEVKMLTSALSIASKENK